MKKKWFALGMGFIFASPWIACNKEVETVPVPPFSVFPNPFTEQFNIYLDGNFPANESLSLKILNGKEESLVHLETVAVGQAVQINAAAWEKAIYYVELTVGEEILIQPILKIE